MERRVINRHMREMLDLSQKDLGELLGVSRETINRYESGKSYSSELEEQIETRLNAFGSIGGYERDDVVRGCCSMLKYRRDELIEKIQKGKE